MKKLCAAVLLWALSSGVGTSALPQVQDLGKGMSELAEKLSKSLAAQGYKNLAAVDFTNLQGTPTELGRFLSERLAVELVIAGGVSMLDRANIKSILAEHKLTEEGLVNPANAKKLGEFAGVDAILIGNVTQLDNGIELIVKAISTDTAKIAAAGRITFPITSDIQSLLRTSVSGAPGGAGVSSAGSAPAPASGQNYQSAGAIATKDLGSLRVVLKSVTPIKASDGDKAGLRCVFDFINRDTVRTLAVAMNAARDEGYTSDRDISQVAYQLRSGIVDENAAAWRLFAPRMSGLSFVRSGVTREPSEIASLLEKRDRLSSDVDTTLDSRPFVAGPMTPIEPGQTLSVVMDFVSQASRAMVPRTIQLNSEIVIGVPNLPGGKKSYSLQNMTFDQITLPGKGLALTARVR